MTAPVMTVVEGACVPEVMSGSLMPSRAAESNTRPVREKQGALIVAIQLPTKKSEHANEIVMTGTTAKALLYELLLEPLRGCKGLTLYRHNLMKRVMAMPDLEVRERLAHLEQLHHFSS